MYMPSEAALRMRCAKMCIRDSPPAVDDPYEYGLIAAANSLSDVWAMGGEPRLCMNVLMFPDSLPPQAVNAILRGGCDKVAEAGAILVGGHTLKDDIPKYGLCVSGLVSPSRIPVSYTHLLCRGYYLAHG